MTGDGNGQRPSPPLREWRERFLFSLGKTGNPLLACRSAGISLETANKARRRSRRFSEQWREAEAASVEVFAAEAWRRALQGVEVPVYRRGRMVGSERKYSPALLKFLQRAGNPRKYDPRYRRLSPQR